MKSVFKFMSIVVLFFTFVLQSFAIDAPNNLRIDSFDNNSVKLSWNKVNDAFMYSVYYSTKPWSEGSYSSQTDITDMNSIEIKDLIPWTYYFSVVSFDESWNESSYSNEIVLNMEKNVSNISQNSDFILKRIDVLGLNLIELTFSSPLENVENAIREFKIVNKNDPIDSFQVIKTEINPDDSTKLILTMNKDTQKLKEYEVTIIAIKSALGKNIESGIDSIEVFIVKDIDYSNIEEVNLAKEIELNAAAEIQENTTWSESEKVLLSVDEKATQLPTTWPQAIILILLSIIIWFFIFIFKTKKA